MREAEAIETVRLVAYEGLGGFNVTVATDGFRLQSRKAAVAKTLGSAGRIMNVKSEGWGAAFEARATTVQIVVNLQQGRDELAQSVIAQIASVANSQMRRRARAAAMGVTRPLDLEQFADPARLSIDVASAWMLHAELGSDDAVVEWLRTGLRALAGSSMTSSAPTPIRVNGFRLVLPTLLNPFQITEMHRPLLGRPRWVDDKISVLVSDEDASSDLARGGRQTLARTLLHGRTVVEIEAWPPATVAGRMVELRRIVAEAHDCDATPGGIERERRFLVQRHLVGVAEAFC